MRLLTHWYLVRNRQILAVPLSHGLRVSYQDISV